MLNSIIKSRRNLFFKKKHFGSLLKTEILGQEKVRNVDLQKIQEDYPDMETSYLEIICKVIPFTMTSVERLYSLIKAVDYIIQNDIPGAFVECGVWKGGSVMAMIEILLEKKTTDRDFFLFDTFEGMSSPSNKDVSYKGEIASEIFEEYADNMDGEVSSKWCRARIDEVKENIENLRYPTEKVNFVKGKVEDTIPDISPESISLLRLDTDWYESTKHELCHLYPLLNQGGILIVDDYGYWQGARCAVDEYWKILDNPPLLQRIDSTGRLAIKP